MDPAVAARMTAHITALADQNEITLHWITRWRDATAYPDEFTALVPRITMPSNYLFGLHELGHCMDPIARRHTWAPATNRYLHVLAEGAAWAWATAEADPALTRHLRAADWDRVAYAYRTYLDPRRYSAPAGPPVNGVFP